MKPKFIVFDIGGVLTYIDKRPIKNLLDAHGVNHGLFFDDDFINLQRGLIGIKDFVTKKSLLLHAKPRQIKEAFAAMITDGSLDILGFLKTPYMVASNINEFHFHRFLSLIPKEIRAPRAVLSYQVGYLKPAIEFFSCLKSILPVHESHVIFIDDKPQNIAIARLIGMQAALCQSPKHLPKILSIWGL